MNRFFRTEICQIWKMKKVNFAFCIILYKSKSYAKDISALKKINILLCILIKTQKKNGKKTHTQTVHFRPTLDRVSQNSV